MNELPEIDLHLTGDAVSIDAMLGYARQAEEAGFSAVWAAEAFRDALVPLAAIAQVTHSMTIGSNIAQWTRSLPNMELAAADLAELSSNRFVLGLGSTTKQWNEQWHGITYERPLQRMREYVDALRLLWTAGPDNPVSFEGDVFTVSDYLRFNGPLQQPVPIALAASRPAMARLAGEIADGIHFNACLSPSFIQQALLPAVRAGMEKAGRSTAPTVRCLTITAIDDDEATARRWARQQLAFYVGVADYFAGLWAHHGLAAEHDAVQGMFRSGDVVGAIDAVPDAAVEAMTITGTPQSARPGLERFGGVVDHVMLYSPGFLLSPDEIASNHAAIITTFAR